MTMTRRHFYSRHAGFSLVEIMVGLVIGLLATLVILQVFSVYEGQKRTTTGTADAQTNGGIALYSMGRDLNMSGFGLLPTGDSAINCSAPAISAAAAAGVTGYTAGVTSLDPVTIYDGSTQTPVSLSDVVTIRYGDSAAAGASMPLTSGPGVNPATVDNNLGCQPNPGIALLISAGAATCNVTTVTALTGTTSITLGDTAGTGGGVNLSCLGKWTEVTYQVNGGNLERDVYPNGLGTTPFIADIVNIQAQYGISNAASSNQIVQWVDATGAWAAGSISIANRNRIKAVRVAVIARNGLQEKKIVTNSYSGQACDPSTLSSTAPVGVCAWVPVSTNPASPAPAIDLSNYPNWQYYRYRVFETIIPLRNVIWAKSVLP
jgi:type IV pilus assembly protein PilW